MPTLAALYLSPHQFPQLEQVTRPTVPTEQAAYYLNRRPQTCGAWACLENGPLRPLRINGRLPGPWLNCAVFSGWPDVLCHLARTCSLGPEPSVPESRGVWVRQAMAIKSEFGEDGFEMWDQWSSLSSAYRAIDARHVWKSVKAGKGIGIGSLF